MTNIAKHKERQRQLQWSLPKNGTDPFRCRCCQVFTKAMDCQNILLHLSTSNKKMVKKRLLPRSLGVLPTQTSQSWSSCRSFPHFQVHHHLVQIVNKIDISEWKGSHAFGLDESRRCYTRIWICSHDISNQPSKGQPEFQKPAHKQLLIDSKTKKACCHRGLQSRDACAKDHCPCKPVRQETES